MNEKTTYENIIADKLGQRQVPDLKEAIWSRIESQLDLDMPDGDNQPPETPKPPKPLRWTAGKKAGLLAGIITVVTVLSFLFQKNDGRQDASPAGAKQGVVKESEDMVLDTSQVTARFWLEKNSLLQFLQCRLLTHRVAPRSLVSARNSSPGFWCRPWHYWSSAFAGECAGHCAQKTSWVYRNNRC